MVKRSLARWPQTAHHCVALEKSFLDPVSEVDFVAVVDWKLRGECRFLCFLLLHFPVQYKN